MKTILVLIFLAAAGGGGWWYFSKNTDKAPEYATVVVSEGAMTQSVTATGTLNPVMNVTVGSQISGYIQELHADFNSSVKAGQVIARLDPATFLATVHQMEGDLAQAQAAHELSKLTAKRKKELVAQNAAPQADLDSALAALNQAQATVQIKEANLERARVDLERCTIRSPIDGTVISRSVDVGQTVAASLNAPVLFLIANDLAKMQIDSNVAEADIGAVEENQDVEFTVDAFPYQTFRGTVAQVRNAATTVQNVVTYNVVVSVANPDLKLKPGMTANVSIIVARRDKVVKIPNAALRFRPPEEAAATSAPPAPAAGGGGQRPPGGGSRPAGPRAERKVYVLASGAAKPEPVPVKLGISDGLNTEVLEGLKAGDAIVIGLKTSSVARPAASSNPLTGGGSFRPR